MSQQTFTEYGHIIQQYMETFSLFCGFINFMMNDKGPGYFTHLFPPIMFLKNDEIILEYFQ